MKNNYCPKCGNLLVPKLIEDEGLVPFCNNCSEPIFNYCNTCVILICENELHEICVIEQSYGFKKPVLIAGYVKYRSTVEETIIDEVKEEIGLDVLDYKFLKSFVQESKDNLMLGFHVSVRKDTLKLSNELSKAGFYSYNEALELLKDSKIAYELLKYYLK